MESTIFIYDGYKGGIGLSEKLYDLLPELLFTTLNLIQDCKCDEECPSCIYSPKCGNNNDPLDKNAAILLLRAQIIKSPLS
jgi:DEAD/DEAH box helicase domain-containing protein